MTDYEDIAVILRNSHILNEEEILTSVDYNDVYEVIDGQQRLTTLLLIYYVCCENLINKPDSPYTIKYQYIRNIDKIYIKNALRTIREWFEKFDDIDDTKHKIKSKINFDVSFIWYEVEKEENSNTIFSKINEGKIPLTSADLFKAKLLSKLENDMSILVFKEWDDIEKQLANDDFWYFISNSKKDLSERMGYLLKIYVSKDYKNKYNVDDDSKLEYNLIEEIIDDNNETIKNIWENIIQIHDILLYWYNDRELYHYIGFLIKCNDYNKLEMTTADFINVLINDTKELTKEETKTYILSKNKKRV